MNKSLPEKMAAEIKKFINEKKRECENIYNKVLREDVFGILQSQCKVLYYSLDDTIEGCHIDKPVNGEIVKFVFINTGKNVQEQVWTAAHELGHVWGIDKYMMEKFGNYDGQFDAEKIVGRFAAEFLMPEEIFVKEVSDKLKQFQYEGTRMHEKMMMELIAYLMNFFCTPYKSIVYRFAELNYIDETDFEQYMQYENSELFRQVIKENQYSRLGKENPSYSIEGFPKQLQEAEEKGVVSKKKIDKIRKIFQIEKQQLGDDNLEFKGIDIRLDDKSCN